MKDDANVTLRQALKELGSVKPYSLEATQHESLCEAISLIRSMLAGSISNQPLQLFHLSRVGWVGSDEYYSFVIAAFSLEKAQQLANDQMQNESYWDWNISTAKTIGVAAFGVELGIISSSFNAG